MVGVGQPIERDRFLAAYAIVVKAMADRGMTYHKTDLDVSLLKRGIRGVDVSELPPIVLRESAVCLTGPFVADPRHADTVSVWMDGGDYPPALEKRMAEALLDQTGKDVAIVDDLSGPAIPCYDLVLVPRETTAELGDAEAIEKMVIEKGIRVGWVDWHGSLTRTLVNRGHYGHLQTVP